ncbi:hypothetical protein BVRB_1g013730 [Beta vulgaris subsp. vulgaris]|nr:hypothetical protein BVRB_1g013730 [Beta vulgaris subsp. vulgaris]
MTKKKTTKLGATGGRSNYQHLGTHEPTTTEYERLRTLRIKENMSNLLFLGLQEKASSLMARVQNNRISKGKYKKVVEEDELYRPEQDVNSEHDFSSSTEELSNDEETLSNQGTKYPPRKICKVKNAIPKAMALAMAFKKKQQRFQGLSSTRGRATRQLLIEHQRTKPSETPEEETRNSNEQGELSRNKTNKQDGKKRTYYVLQSPWTK